MSNLNTSGATISAGLVGGGDPSGDAVLIDAFERLGPAYMRWVRSQIRPDAAGVTVARLKMLGMLKAMGAKPMGVLAREGGVAPRTVTALVDGLEREGLARRVPHPTDRRATLIEITENGTKALRACLRPHRASVTSLFQEFPPDDRAALARLIPKLVEAIEARTRRI